MTSPKIKVAEEIIRVYKLSASIQDITEAISDWHPIKTLEGEKLAVHVHVNWYLIDGDFFNI